MGGKGCREQGEVGEFTVPFWEARSQKRGAGSYYLHLWSSFVFHSFRAYALWLVSPPNHNEYSQEQPRKSYLIK